MISETQVQGAAEFVYKIMGTRLTRLQIYQLAEILRQSPVYNHQVHCNASREQPFGCSGCSCRAWKPETVDDEPQ